MALDVPREVPSVDVAAVGRRRLAQWFGVLVGLNALDLVTTRLVLERGGGEANPVLEPIIANLLGAFLVKALCLALVGALLRRVRYSVRVTAVLVAVNAWYLLVVCWNVRVLAHLA